MKITGTFVCVFLLAASLLPTLVFALEPPAEVDWESNTDSSATLQWVNVDPDSRVEIEFLQSNGTWVSLLRSPTPAGLDNKRFTGLTAGTTAVFRLRTVVVGADGTTTEASAYTENVEVATRGDLAITATACVLQSPGTVDLPVQLTGFTTDQVEVAGGNETFRVAESPVRVTGTLDSGSHRIVISARAGRHQRHFVSAVTITEAPEIAVPVAALMGSAISESDVIDLNQTFVDPDTETVVRVATVLGDIDVALDEAAAPLTVANFLHYADRGDWVNTFFHRSLKASISILQGGGFTFESEGQIQQVSRAPAVTNEFRADRPNVCGTIAMAKGSSDPDSATSEWFFNATDNSRTLDTAAGGFTTFGRVMGGGMNVVQAIADLPTADFTVDVVTCEGVSPDQVCSEAKFNLNDWPLLQVREDGLDTDDLVTISSVARISPMTFSVVSNSAPDVAGATISGQGLLTVDYIAPGQATITIAATDRDGATTRHEFTVSVQDSFEAWALSMGLEGDQATPVANPDEDDSSNLLEYGFGGNPLTRDSPFTEGSFERAGQAEFPSPAITFLYRAHAGDLDYAVQSSGGLGIEWSDIWTSADGVDASNVIGAEHAGNGLVKLTVSVISAPLPVFLRVKVSSR